jgi:formylglycine-generating enzyme required for sulfatase activity
LLLGGQRTPLQRMPRPAWAQGFYCDQAGSHITVPLPWDSAGATLLWGAQPDLDKLSFNLRDPSGNHVVGLDAHGLYAQFQLGKQHGGAEVAFTLRYIPPGSFLMGSPVGEGLADEHPQHPVTISTGFWLADTPCTQALWQAVMGENPSDFRKGANALQHPVVLVDVEDDVPQFFKKLQTLLPAGCVPELPREAQWEYAARAGTQTAYWWGDAPDASRANWDDNQKGTTPVKRYPANPWGLYDVHGNVLEWCADDQRPYAEQPERDPQGDREAGARVVRGGSWLNHPGGARSAFRLRWRVGDRHLPQGFRFLLRSSSPAPGGREPAPGGPGLQQPGGPVFSAAGGTQRGRAPKSTTTKKMKP